MALSPEYLQGLPEELENLTMQFEADIIADISRRIAKAGGITDTAEYQMMILKEMGASTEYLEKLISEYTGYSEKIIKQMIFDAAQTDSDFYGSVYSRVNRPYVPFEHNEYLQQLAVAAVNQTCGELTNFTRTMGFSARGTDGRIYFKSCADTYRSAMDKAFTLTALGGMDYLSAVRMAAKELTASGLQFVDYASGVRNHADVAVRRALLTGVSQMTGKIAERNAQELDTDVVEVSAHAGARPDHAAWQGKWYSLKGRDKRYPLLASATGYGSVTGLKGANCRHDFYPVIPGISEPSYTAEELRNIDPPPVTIDGKTYTYYEAEQRQRAFERAIRKTKREIIAADASGDKDMFTAKSVLLRRQKEAYGKFSKQAGLLPRIERTGVAEYGHSISTKSVWADRKETLKSSAAALTTAGNGGIINSSGKMSAFKNDWSEALPQTHSKKELNEIVSYAKSKNIRIYNPRAFDGDTDILKSHIDNISSLREQYNIKKNITIAFQSMDDDDFAETKKRTITFNLKTLRNKTVTNSNLQKDNYLSSNNYLGISSHEMGHIIAHTYGEKGLDIAKQAYFNVFGEKLSDDAILNYLEDNVSLYSTTEYVTINGKKRTYIEIIPEMLGKYTAGESNKFTEEFVKILKGLI